MTAATDRITVAQAPSQWWIVELRISSLLQNPARGTTPAKAREPKKKVVPVTGIFRHSPPSLSISWLW